MHGGPLPKQPHGMLTYAAGILAYLLGQRQQGFDGRANEKV
jgi:hypothetical protein